MNEAWQREFGRPGAAANRSIRFINTNGPTAASEFNGRRQPIRSSADNNGIVVCQETPVFLLRYLCRQVCCLHGLSQHEWQPVQEPQSIHGLWSIERMTYGLKDENWDRGPFEQPCTFIRGTKDYMKLFRSIVFAMSSLRRVWRARTPAVPCQINRPRVPSICWC